MNLDAKSSGDESTASNKSKKLPSKTTIKKKSDNKSISKREDFMKTGVNKAKDIIATNKIIKRVPQKSNTAAKIMAAINKEINTIKNSNELSNTVEEGTKDPSTQTNTQEDNPMDTTEISNSSTSSQHYRRSISPNSIDGRVCTGDREGLARQAKKILTPKTPNKNTPKTPNKNTFTSQYYDERQQAEFLRLPTMQELHNKPILPPNSQTSPILSPSRLLQRRSSFSNDMETERNNPFQRPKNTIPLKNLIKKRLNGRWKQITDSAHYLKPVRMMKILRNQINPIQPIRREQTVEKEKGLKSDNLNNNKNNKAR